MRARRLLPLLFAAGACGHDQTFPSLQGLVVVSGRSPFSPGCGGAPVGQLYLDAVVEPYLAADAKDPLHLIGVWQQDRWSNGGANGVGSAVSFDGGLTWSRSFAHFTRCAGGTAANGGDYQRASDPWIAFAPDGTAHQIALAFDSADTRRAILASRSQDGGRTWSEPSTLTSDNSRDFVIDKESITADPLSAQYLYAVWDRLTGQTNPNSPLDTGPTWFARSSDGGASWEPARSIYDPGADAQTISNQIVVLPDGTLLDLFTLVTSMSTSTPQFTTQLIRSTDRGATWSAAALVAPQQFVGVVDAKLHRPVRTGPAVFAATAAGNKIWVAWEDSRFSGDVRDGIALSRSDDGGLTWSQPAQANQAPLVQAFTPQLAAIPGGALGLSYYDFRDDNPADGSRLLATRWLATSADGGATWKETALGPPFDLRKAPVTNDGLFLGDYQGLARAGTSLVPFFVLTESRTEVVARPLSSVAGVARGAPLTVDDGLRWPRPAARLTRP
jgi:hypothetical protein